MHSLFRSIKFLNYSFTALNAHRLHSPFVYDLYTNVICDPSHYYSFETVESIRAKMLLSKRDITVTDFGTGGINGNKKKTALSYIAGHYVKPKKYGQLLFRLVNYFKPKNIL